MSYDLSYFLKIETDEILMVVKNGKAYKFYMSMPGQFKDISNLIEERL